jgi:hypothetical protein
MDNPETLVTFLFGFFSSCLCYMCLWIVHSWLQLRFSLPFIFILPVLQVSLDCPFLIAPSVFSNVYFHLAGVTSVSGWSILDCTFGFLYRLFSSCRCYKCLWMVHSWLHLRFSLPFIFILSVLQVSLDGPFLIAPSVFSNVYFHPAGVTSVSGWSILDCTFGFLYRLFSSCRCYTCLWIVLSGLHLRFSLTFLLILPVCNQEWTIQRHL